MTSDEGFQKLANILQRLTEDIVAYNYTSATLQSESLHA